MAETLLQSTEYRCPADSTICYAVGAANDAAVWELQRQLNRVAALVIAVPPTLLKVDGKIGDGTAARVALVATEIPNAVIPTFPALSVFRPTVDGNKYLIKSRENVIVAVRHLVADLQRVSPATLAPPVPVAPVATMPATMPYPATKSALRVFKMPTTLPAKTTAAVPGTPAVIATFPPGLKPSGGFPWPFFALGAAGLAAVGTFLFVALRRPAAAQPSATATVAGIDGDPLLDHYDEVMAKSRPTAHELDLLAKRLDLCAHIARTPKASLCKKRFAVVERLRHRA
jgi:hypothetical protein